jgi:hypothetical protein
MIKMSAPRIAAAKILELVNMNLLYVMTTMLVLLIVAMLPMVVIGKLLFVQKSHAKTSIVIKIMDVNMNQSLVMIMTHVQLIIVIVNQTPVNILLWIVTTITNVPVTSALKESVTL